MELNDLLLTALQVSIVLSAVLLVPTMFVGLVFSVLQAATQVQDQTLTYLPKLIVLILLGVFFGGWIVDLLSEFTEQVFAEISRAS